MNHTINRKYLLQLIRQTKAAWGVMKHQLDETLRRGDRYKENLVKAKSGLTGDDLANVESAIKSWDNFKTQVLGISRVIAGLPPLPNLVPKPSPSANKKKKKRSSGEGSE